MKLDSVMIVHIEDPSKVEFLTQRAGFKFAHNCQPMSYCLEDDGFDLGDLPPLSEMYVLTDRELNVDIHDVGIIFQVCELLKDDDYINAKDII
jgi:hypothetical protein